MLTSVVRKGCVALHYSVHFFFYEFSLSRNDRNRGGGYRRKICTVKSATVGFNFDVPVASAILFFTPSRTNFNIQYS